MPFMVRNKLLLAKEESEYGVDPTPTVGDNALAVRNLKVNYQGDILERDLHASDLSPSQGVIGKRSMEITFEMDLAWSGIKGTASRLGDLLEACGMAETASAGSSVVYKPTSDSVKSCTFYVYEQFSASSSKLHKITGARGNVEITLTAGQMAKLGFTFRGKYNAPADVAKPSTPTFETVLPPIVRSAGFTLNSVSTLVVQEMSLDTANEIVDQDDINDATGVASILISSRRPTGRFNPEAVMSTTYNFHSDWINATARALSVVVGSEAGNKCTITAPKVTIDSVTDGDKNGIRTEDLPFKLNRNLGNDEYVLTFE